MRRTHEWAAVFLALLLAISILLMWVDGKWINPSLFQAGLFGLVMVWCGRLVMLADTTPGQVRWSFCLTPLGGASMWALLQLATWQTVSRWETWNAALMWAGNLAAFWIALQICDHAKPRRLLLTGMIIFAFAISVVSVLQFFSTPGKVLWIYSNGESNFGPFVNRDRFAAFAELMLPVAAMLASRGDRKRWFFAAAAATLFASVIAGASRAGSVLVVAEAVTLTIWGRDRGGKNWPVAVFLMMSVVFTAVAGAGTLLTRFAEPDPYAARREYLASALAMTADRPGMGFGLGNFENSYPAYARIDMNTNLNHAHNDWAEWAAEGGLPFLGLMLCLAGWAIPRAMQSFWGLGIVAVMMHATVDFPLQNPAIEFWVFTLMGVLASSGTREIWY